MEDGVQYEPVRDPTTGKVYSQEDLQRIVELIKSGKTQAATNQEQVEVTDGEYAILVQIQLDVQRKYYGKPANEETLRSLCEEIIDRARNEAKLECTVDPFPAFTGDPVEVTVEERLTPFDMERHIEEVRSGVADEIWDSQRPQT